MQKSNQQLQARNHESYGAFTVLAVLLPPVGIILGIIYLAKSDPLSRKLGEHTIAFAVFAAIIISILWYLFIPHQLATPATYTPSAVAPIRNIDSVYEQVTVGMSKEQVATLIERTPENCAETDGGVAGVFESCSYGAPTTDNGLIVVNYHNGVVTTKSKAHF